MRDLFLNLENEIYSNSQLNDPADRFRLMLYFQLIAELLKIL